MRRLMLLGLACAATAGCDDTLWGVSAEPIAETGYAGVQAVAEQRCFVCHSASSAQGQLDLETDLHNAVVSVPSSTDPSWLLVAPGDPDASLLYRFAAGDGPPEVGITDMPPGSGGVSDDELKIIEDWIVAGASEQ